MLDVTPSGQLSLAWEGPQVFYWFVVIFDMTVVGFASCIWLLKWQFSDWSGMPAKSYCSIRNILSFCIKTITLRVCLTQGQDIDHYIVEYYRDQWQLWLRYLDTHNLKIELLPSTSSSLSIDTVYYKHFQDFTSITFQNENLLGHKHCHHWPDSRQQGSYYNVQWK